MRAILSTIILLGLATVTTRADGGRQPQAATTEVVARIQVHGNNATPDEDVLALAGVKVGDVFTAAMLGEVRDRLLASERFEGASVLKRYASITDLSQVVLVIVIDEHAVSVLPSDEADIGPRLRRRGWTRNLLFLPIVDAEDGYGLTFGARIAYLDLAGRSSRVSFPLTWGGTKAAGAEFERTFARGPFDRVLVGTSMGTRRNPAYDIVDGRRRVWARAERVDGPLRLGATLGEERVSFDRDVQRMRTFTVDATVDTRLDPAFPRNAVLIRAAVTRYSVAHTVVVQRSVDATGYLGLVGQSVLVGRVWRQDATAPLPRYLRPLLGGWANLRGFRAGAFTGDAVAAGSLEWRVPLSSPVHVARVGVSVFVDAGRVSDVGERWNARPLQVGGGAGLWATATVLRFGVSVARGRDADTRVNFGATLGF